MIVVILMIDDHDDGAGVGLGDISGVNADGNVMSLKVRDRLYKRARHTEPTSKTADEHGIPILVRFPSLLSSKYGISTLVRFPSLLSAISARNQIGPCVYHGRHVAWWYMASIWSVLRGGPPPRMGRYRRQLVVSMLSFVNMCICVYDKQQLLMIRVTVGDGGCCTKKHKTYTSHSYSASIDTTPAHLGHEI